MVHQIASSLDVRNRIVRHVRIRAGDLVPHELNPRVHPDAQRAALEALYVEVGFARSLLAYELPDGRLKLIDGHLRQRIDPEMMVDVEVLDVNDAEARKLLLSLDPLAALADNDTDKLDELRRLTASDSDALTNLWRGIGEAAERVPKPRREPKPPPEARSQWYVLIECQDEANQLELLRRFLAEGLKCRALLS
ncbi:MAG: hypothetical protein EBV06_04725 [Planctomycetia bacterium]|nr:hypothetical protein [Planctomycetia bacterium]